MEQESDHLTHTGMKNLHPQQVSSPVVLLQAPLGDVKSNSYYGKHPGRSSAGKWVQLIGKARDNGQQRLSEAENVGIRGISSFNSGVGWATLAMVLLEKNSLQGLWEQ